MPRLQIMDTTIRDGQQSLWATRMQIGDMLPILGIGLIVLASLIALSWPAAGVVQERMTRTRMCRESQATA